jgi:two-component system response regulator HydG
MSLRTQTDLLRVLEEKEIVRAGCKPEIKLDFRCIAATSRNLGRLVKTGSFQPELYERLSAYCIDLPPLRERREDIPLLVDHFVNRFCMATSRPVPQLASEALETLVRHDWPGNVRELQNVVERALVVGRGAQIRPSDFSLQFQADEPGPCNTLEEIERVHIQRILGETRRNLSRAARVLDIDRTTLYNKLRRYGLR